MTKEKRVQIEILLANCKCKSIWTADSVCTLTHTTRAEIWPTASLSVGACPIETIKILPRASIADAGHLFLGGGAGFEPARFIFKFLLRYRFQSNYIGSIVWSPPITTDSHHNIYTFHINSSRKFNKRNYKLQWTEAEGKYFCRTKTFEIQHHKKNKKQNNGAVAQRQPEKETGSPKRVACFALSWYS